jgi:hypothetical protein
MLIALVSQVPNPPLPLQGTVSSSTTLVVREHRNVFIQVLFLALFPYLPLRSPASSNMGRYDGRRRLVQHQGDVRSLGHGRAHPSHGGLQVQKEPLDAARQVGEPRVHIERLSARHGWCVGCTLPLVRLSNSRSVFLDSHTPSVLGRHNRRRVCSFRGHCLLDRRAVQGGLAQALPQ